MYLLDALCVVTALVLFLLVLVDMFRRKVWWGLVGLFTFVPTYYFVIRHYRGNRKVIAPLYFLATLFPAIHLYNVAQEGERRVQPFVSEVSRKLEIDCKSTGDFSMSSSKSTYLVLCSPRNLNAVSFKDVEGMIANYRTAYARPMIPIFNDKLHTYPDAAIKIGIKSPLNMFACYELFNGDIPKAWATGPDEPCNK
jgi:hypothetical protein